MRTLLVASVFTIALPASGMDLDVPDTTRLTTVEKTSNARLNVRLHSAGLFAYSGRIVCNNPVADINFTYERKLWGYMFFKAEDLKDGRTDINFALTGFYTNIHVSKKLTITPFVAFRMEQTTKVADKGSDAIFIVTTAYRFHHDWILDNSSLLSNIMLEKKDIDWINRYRLLYSHKHIDAGLMVWNNTKVLNHDHYVSGGMNIAYSRIKLSDHLLVSAGMTGIVMMTTSDTSEFPKTNGLVFTLAATLH